MDVPGVRSQAEEGRTGYVYEYGRKSKRQTRWFEPAGLYLGAADR
jgi:hypothetical protein